MTRHIDKPDELPIKEGAICWINSQRVCGPDCVAFNVDELDEHGIASDGPHRCTVIVLLGQVGSGAGQLVQLMTKAQQQARTPQQPAPPKVG